MDKTQNIIELLKTYNQEHIIKLLNKLEGKEKENLIEQIEKIDFHQIMELYDNTKKELKIKENKIENIAYLDKAKLSKQQKEEFNNLGEELIRKGEYAVVTMAGGQGTRLGHNGPKGTFKLDVYGKGKYLFEILAENLKEANKKYEVTIPWYIMTSKENHNERGIHHFRGLWYSVASQCLNVTRQATFSIQSLFRHTFEVHKSSVFQTIIGG